MPTDGADWWLRAGDRPGENDAVGVGVLRTMLPSWRDGADC